MSESTEKGQHRQIDQPPLTDAEREIVGTLVPATSAGMPPTAQAFFAVVDVTGSLVRGFGAVSATKLGTGTYQVTFSHSVTGSAYIATLGLPGSLGVGPAGEITVVGRAGLANGVFVATFNSSGGFADRGFHIAVLS